MTLQEPTEEQTKQRYRKRWMLGCTAAGVLMVLATFKVAGKNDYDDVFVAFMVEAAAALVLLALFFVLERSFMRTVERTVATQVQQQVAPLEAKVDALTTEIAGLQANVDERTERQTAHHHHLVNAMDRPTFATITDALSEATRLSAIVGGAISVQANADPRGIWLNFTYGGWYVNQEPISLDELVVTAEVSREDHPKRTEIKAPWPEGAAAEDVAAQINDMLRSAEVRQPRNRPDWTLALGNLKRSLDLALPLDSDSPWQLQAALHELVGNDWAITKAGLEHRVHGLVIPAGDFPENPFPLRIPGAPEPEQWEPPAMPEGCDPGEWGVVVERAKGLLSRTNRHVPIPFFSESIQRWVPRGRPPNVEY